MTTSQGETTAADTGYVYPYPAEGYGGEEYFEISSNVWKFIQEHIVDKRPGGEWHSQIDDNWNYAPFKPVVDPWKCPYHNGRMCLEMIRRLADK